jgi:uncharacterized protein
MKPIISMITLGVSDFEKSLKFYRDGLSFKSHNYKESDGFIFFEMDGTWLALYPKDRLAKDATISSDGSGFAGITLSHNVKTKEEVDSVFALAISVGAKLIKKPQKVFWGGYSGYFADPDGYLWEVAFNPFTDLT